MCDVNDLEYRVGYGPPRTKRSRDRLRVLVGKGL